MGSIDEYKALQSDQNIAEQSEICFYVNGKLQNVKNDYPIDTPLVKYMREVLNLTGTKSYCNDGGCGVCVVQGRKFNASLNHYENVSLNSCLFPLYNANGWEFTTIEGIGGKKDGLNEIQKRLADANGSQCGYCSPGFVMNMYNLLKNSPKPTAKQIENSLDGNICRCTGYPAILESMKSFAVDANPIDIEDLSKIASRCNKSCTRSTQEEHACQSLTTHISANKREWFQPKTLTDLNIIYNSEKKIKQHSVQFQLANTSKGVYKSTDNNSTVINLSNVAELNEIRASDTELNVGSAVTIGKLIEQLRKLANERSNFEHMKQVADHLDTIGSVHIRNMAGWAGNLCMKRDHLDFPSDVVIAFEAANAKLNLINLNGSVLSKPVEMELSSFLYNKTIDQQDMFIHSVSFPSIVDQSKTFIRTYKCKQRSQNCHSYVNASFRLKMLSKTVPESVSIVFSGLGDKYFHAVALENFLSSGDKDLSDENLFKQSIDILVEDLSTCCDSDDAKKAQTSSMTYRINLALSFYYKFVVELNLLTGDKDRISEIYKSACLSFNDPRNKSNSDETDQGKLIEHSFCDSDSSVLPVTKPIAKLNAYSQTAGETKFTNDLPRLPHQLDGVFILTTIGRGSIASINTEKAEKIPGVARILFAKDIIGENSFMGGIFAVEPVFCESEILYAGQPVGIVLADTYEQAWEASKLVEITYENVKKPILTIPDAISEKSFHLKSPDSPFDIKTGNAYEAIKNAKHKLSGEIELNSSQYHFYMEGMCAICEPTDDGYNLECTTQWIDSVNTAVALVLGKNTNASKIDIQVKQIGGGFGGKTSRPSHLGAVAALGAHLLQRPVKVNMDLSTTMSIFGKRPSWLVRYTVGFNDDGKLEGIEFDCYTDPGCSMNGSLVPALKHFIDNAYKCENYIVNFNICKTNKPASTEMRAPDILGTFSFMEHIFEHMSFYLKQDILELRRNNFYKQGDVSLGGLALNNFHLDQMVDELMASSKYVQKKKEIDEFNAKNRFKKRGLALTPVRYNLTHNFSYYNALVSISHYDGSVAVSHGGIEMGQGIHTKVAQVCAYELGIPIEKISVKSTNNLINPNSIWSGGSTTSELCCSAIMGCCTKLKETLEPIRKLMPSDSYTWEELIKTAFEHNCNLTTISLQAPQGKQEIIKMTYDTYGCSFSEVMIDTLTGEIDLLCSELYYDCGRSLNSLIDIGQAEGGFTIGLGYWLFEKTIYDSETGVCLNNGTWDYKPPLASNLPAEFKIRFKKDSLNPIGVLGSKGIGEPAIVLSNSIYFAVRNAIRAANMASGIIEYRNVEAPCTPDVVQRACQVEIKDFKFC